MDHLNVKVRGHIRESVESRIQSLREKKWVGYPAATKLLSKMDDLLNHPQTHRMPNLLIKADTNNGKSFVLKKFCKLNQPYEDRKTELLVIPVVKIEIPADPSTDTIYSEILQEMEIPYRATFKKEIKANMVFNAFNRFRVRMLLIDELHVLMNTTRLKKAQMLDTLKYIANKTGVVLVGAGTLEAHTAIVSDPQLANRFEPYLLPQWKLNADFRRLLATFEKVTPLAEPSNMQSQELATEIYSMSNGWIGEVDEVIKRAAIHAMEVGHEKITIDTLRAIDWISPEKRRYTGR